LTFKILPLEIMSFIGEKGITDKYFISKQSQQKI